MKINKTLEAIVILIKAVNIEPRLTEDVKNNAIFDVVRDNGENKKIGLRNRSYVSHTCCECCNSIKINLNYS